MVARVMLVALRVALATVVGFQAALLTALLLNGVVPPVSCMPMVEVAATCLRTAPWVPVVVLAVGIIVMFATVVVTRRLRPRRPSAPL